MLPVVIIHNAVSADGRTDWFTPDIEKFYELTNSWNEDATLAGSDTLLAAYSEVNKSDSEESLADDAEKGPDDSRPLLLVPDSRGRLRIWHLLKKEPYWKDVIAFCSKSTSQEYLDYLTKTHVDFIIAGEDKVDYKIALEEINTRYNVNTVRVDSGGTLNGVLLRSGLVQEVSILIHPCLVGGNSSRSLFRAEDLTSPDGVIELKLANIQKLDGELIWIRYNVIKKE